MKLPRWNKEIAMDWDVIEAKMLAPGRIQVTFADGLQGTVRFEAYRGIFAKLQDPQEFSKLFVNDYFVTWPGELDLAPDAMHAQIAHTGECVIH
jgi:hypothetical protein